MCVPLYKSRVVGEATGARPRTVPTIPTVNQSRQIIKEKLDQNEDLKEELKERNVKKNAQKIVDADSKDKAKKIAQKMKGTIREITACRAAKMRAIQHQIWKKKKSIKRAANHQKSAMFNGVPELERERPKLKIPPLDDGESSATYYTSDSSDSDSDDSIPSVDWDY